MSGVSSNPRKDSGGNQTTSDQRQKILVTGWRKYVCSAKEASPLTLRRAGKSSCIKTVFQNLPVKDVPYIGITQKLEKVNYEYVCLRRRELTGSTIVPLQIWDTPSNFELDQLDTPLASFSTIVYVMDMQVRVALLHFEANRPRRTILTMRLSDRQYMSSSAGISQTQP